MPRLGPTLTVHPRARGEHVIEVWNPETGERSIPAHAGNTWRQAQRYGVLGGPSPRTRGTHFEKTMTYIEISGRRPDPIYGVLESSSLTGSLKRSTACFQAASCTATRVSPSASTRLRWARL